MIAMTTARMSPASPPFSVEMQSRLDRIMPPGVQPLALFATLARDERLFVKFFSGSLLDRGHLTIRQREIVIDRTTALCGSEYEWGIHVTHFGERAKLTEEQIYSFVHGNVDDPCWSPEEQVLVRLCDSLHHQVAVTDELWASLRSHFSEEAILELLMLAGFYRTVSYLTNGLRLPLETSGRRFPNKK